MYYIYVYENKINNKLYIGYTNNIQRRDKEHIRHSIYYFGNALKKYGRENFILNIITIKDTKEEAKCEEIYWINRMKEFIGEENLYNLTNGGDGGMSEQLKQKLKLINTGKKRSKETIKRLSESHKGKISGNKGKRKEGSKSFVRNGKTSAHAKNMTWKIIDGKRVWINKEVF